MISLFPHQQEALQETKDFDNIAVYHDMGLGKTFTGSEMMKRFGCKVNLIVCQKSKVQDWVEHFTDNYQMQVFDLTNKKQLGEYHGLSQGQRFFIVGVINYELAAVKIKTLHLKYIGRDDWGRYVYEDENGKLWKNTDCCSPRECCEERGDTLNSSAGNEFDGEPDCFMAAHIKVEYLPEEGGEQDG